MAKTILNFHSDYLHPSLRPPMALIFTLLKLKISGHVLVMFNFLIAIMMFNFLILIIILKFASLRPQMALTSV